MMEPCVSIVENQWQVVEPVSDVNRKPPIYWALSEHAFIELGDDLIIATLDLFVKLKLTVEEAQELKALLVVWSSLLLTPGE